MEPTVPSPSKRWSRWHDRLHRQLLAEPTLLPDGTKLLLAVSGGQDSMALLALLQDLQRLHRWELLVWHGDHGWHEGSAAIAFELKQWCEAQGQAITLSQASSGNGSGNTRLGKPTSEDAARTWRYGELQQLASDQGMDVVTGHTATDRAETLLLNLARGCDLGGLGSLRPQRPLAHNQPDGPQLRRPMLCFSRKETLAICEELGLPIWLDPSNEDTSYARNRIRLEILPVLEDIHLGSSQRIADLAERMSHVRDTQQELATLALAPLLNTDGALNRRELNQLSQASRRQLLEVWLHHQGANRLTSTLLNTLVVHTSPKRSPGQIDLNGDLRLTWNRQWIKLQHNGEGI